MGHLGILLNSDSDSVCSSGPETASLTSFGVILVVWDPHFGQDGYNMYKVKQVN
jgi:hypothetical protein